MIRRSSTSAAPSAPHPPNTGGPWPPGTVAVCSPAATDPPATAEPTTSNGGTATDGETSLQNLALLCHHHHHLVHEGGWKLTRAPDGQLQFHRPDGTPFRL